MQVTVGGRDIVLEVAVATQPGVLAVDDLFEHFVHDFAPWESFRKNTVYIYSILIIIARRSEQEMVLRGEVRWLVNVLLSALRWEIQPE